MVETSSRSAIPTARMLEMWGYDVLSTSKTHGGRDLEISTVPDYVMDMKNTASRTIRPHCENEATMLCSSILL
ncbi:hypothetical protein E1B28_005242 [Marasmius oreades]|uniref:Uncharacterized protein n=1 Tax=Marasmius oreades TaxID=181124 RepID=A0A9P8ADM1_9AGAR|nr:uncharacterized protein E1B28_005242 [Marasmius oreades]KAG7097931.1 hypothetical protein E1B28_005242 [Marasmius oreades]